MRLDTLINNSARPIPTTRRSTKYTDPEVVTRISTLCSTPQLREHIVLKLGGNRHQVTRVLDQMCLDHLLAVSWKRVRVGPSARECAFYTRATE